MTSELIADVFVSLDGFAAGRDEPAYFGYAGPELSGWVEAQLGAPQIILMGRKTYEVLEGHASEATDPGSVRMRALPKRVFSNTLSDPLSWDNSEVIAGDLAEAIGALKDRAGVPIRTFGSIQLVAGLMALGLVDRLRLMVFPVILGDAGKEALFANHERAALRLRSSTILDDRIVLLEYEPGARVGGT